MAQRPMEKALSFYNSRTEKYTPLHEMMILIDSDPL